MIVKGNVVVPVFIEAEKQGRPKWKLLRINLADRKDLQLLDNIHIGTVTAVAASADGRRLASADATGQLFIVDLSQKRPKSLRINPGRVVFSLCLTPDGGTLLAGTEHPITQVTSGRQSA